MNSNLKKQLSLLQNIAQLIAQIELYQVLRLGIVAVILLGSAVLGPGIMKMGSRFLIILLLPVAAVGLLALLRWPDFGLVLIIICSLLVPYSIGTGTQTGLNATFLIILVLIFLWVFKMVALRETGIKRVPGSFWPAVAIIISALISFGFGQFAWFPIPGASMNAQFGGLMIFVLSAGLFLLVAFHLQHIASLHWIVGAFIGLSGIYMVANLVPQIGQLVNPFFIPRSVNESLFWCWFGVLCFCQAVFNQKLKPGLRAVLGVLALSAIYITWFMKRDWTSGWFPLILGIGISMVAARPRLALPGVLLVLIGLMINSQQIVNTVMIGDNEYSMMTRLEAWRTLAGIASANPLFGLGPANYYWYTLLFPILGYNVTFNSHNNYADIILQVGLVGLGFYLWFLWQTGREIWKAIPLASQGFERAFLYSCLGGLGATALAGMLGDWVLPFVYNIGLEGFRVSVLAWLFLGAGIAISRRVAETGQAVRVHSTDAGAFMKSEE